MDLEHEKDLERIKQFVLMDDDFMRLCFDDNLEAVELVVRIVLDRDDIFVKKVQIQKQYNNLSGHGIEIDVYGEDAEKRQIGIEIQRDDRGATPKRAGYHSSLLDASSLPKGKNYPEKYENYSIWFTEHDVLGGDKPLYHIERYILEEQREFGDNAHIIYVNGAYKGDPESKLGLLVHDFFCADPDDMHYKVLADRARHFKKSREGLTTMCKMLEEMRKEAEITSLVNSINKLVKNCGWSAERAMEVLEIPVAEREFYLARL